jgi:hypothetical protein
MSNLVTHPLRGVVYLVLLGPFSRFRPIIPAPPILKLLLNMLAFVEARFIAINVPLEHRSHPDTQVAFKALAWYLINWAI